MNHDKFYNFDLTSLDVMEKLIILSLVCKKIVDVPILNIFYVIVYKLKI